MVTVLYDRRPSYVWHSFVQYNLQMESYSDDTDCVEEILMVMVANGPLPGILVREYNSIGGIYIYE